MSGFYIPTKIDALQIDLTGLVAKVRADAIEECKKIVKAECTTNCKYLFSPDCIKCMCEQMEELKEQKNE